jgi:hypothetical protein
MVRFKPIVFALAAAGVGVASHAHAAKVTSTFDNLSAGLDGWTVGDIASSTSTAADPNNPPAYNATGGNPGGYISTMDTENIVAFLAPSKFTGNDSAYNGGVLSFDLQDKDGTDAIAYPAVVLYSSAGPAISYSLGYPNTTWTSFSVPLMASGWTVYPGDENNGTTPVTDAQFAADLATVTNLAIEADWRTGSDLTGLDNVTLASGSVSAAPEPSTWALMFAGLGGIGLILRRAKNTMTFRFKDAFAA